MKKDVVLFLTVLLFLSPVFAGPGSSEGAETFPLMEKSPIFLYFENYQMRDGWTPVVLSIGELNCLLWMDAAGRVSELLETGAHFVEPVCFIDVPTQSLRKGANTLYFDVYEQNRVRTRWRFSPGETAGTVPKKILFREPGIELYLGNLRLKLNHVAWDFRELSPGLFQVKFYGPMVLEHRELVYEKAKGIIYSTHGWNNRLPTGLSRTWTMNSNMPASGSIPPRERAALIALYNSTAGDNWKNKSGWKTPPLAADGFALPGTENTWYGITCDTGNTTVQSINLESNNLNGSLPPELGNLASLHGLYFGWNSLSGSMPPELGNLANLELLYLMSNQITGSIPPELGNLVNLKSFDLMWNQVSGNIPPELGNLANLQVLHIGYNSLIGSIPQELGNLTNLQSLWLHRNQLSGTIPPELGNMANLQELVLRHNQLSGTIPLELTRLSNLVWLDLSDNPLSGTIPPELGTLAKLQYLHLVRNQLSGTIPLELTNLSNLISLNFGLNQLSGTIPKELERLSNLGVLGLYFNQFSGTIPSELGNLTNLGWLRLNSNQLSGGIPPELGNLVNLYWLDLSRNQLSDGIPLELGNLKNLGHLSIDSNQLSGSILPELGNLKNLGYLSIASNQFRGSIPPELGNLVNLYYLELNSNQLCGSIPSELGNLSKLARLQLNFNYLSGEIPSNLTNLGSINLDIGHNCLRATDPATRTWLDTNDPDWEAYQDQCGTTPTVTTKSVSSITSSSAVCGGNVTSDGCNAVTAKGVCWSTSSNPTISDSKTTDGSGTGSFTSSITGLSPNTLYHVRAYATNSRGTSYGTDKSFNTNPIIPSTYTLYVKSSPGTGVSITVSPNDNSNQGDGTTNFTRTYNSGTNVSLTAPSTYNNKDFSKWTVGSTDYTSTTVQVSMTGNKTAIAIYVTSSPAEISLNRSRLNYGKEINGPSTRPQSIMVSNPGGGTLNWSATADVSWLSLNPSSGTNCGEISVSVNISGLSAGTYTGAITVSDPDAANSPQTVLVSLEVYRSGTTSIPFGVFATPIDGSTVMSSIPVTGWVLDDIEVESLKIYRGSVNNLVYIGDAVFVEGPRPDVEQAYPDYPLNYKAGWGYMMLTNFLPNGGNGIFEIHAIATDVEGHQVTLGTKTINVDNANAVKPFGAIDTPTQGGIASGSSFINWGWVLTPRPNSIPTDGSSIKVWVDGINIGQPTYNNYRSDIAKLFPCYNNSDSAAGYFFIDTTAYDNGLHTIQWTATDSGGDTDGIGSRYFTIQNTQNCKPAQAKTSSLKRLTINDLMHIPSQSFAPLRAKSGFESDNRSRILLPDDSGISRMSVKETGRMEIQFGGSVTVVQGGQLVDGTLTGLPIGSIVDPVTGKFTWSLGPGFLGKYHLVFVVQDSEGEYFKEQVEVTVEPRFAY